MGNKNRHHHQQQTNPPRAQEPQQGIGGGGAIEDTPEPAVGPLEDALQDTRERAIFMLEKSEAGLPVYPTGEIADMKLQLDSGKFEIVEPTERDENPEQSAKDYHDYTKWLKSAEGGEALEAVDREFHGQGVFHTNAEMIKYLEDRGYQVIQPVQNLDRAAGLVAVSVSAATTISSKFDNLKFDDPDKFRVARQVTNGNIMVMVELPETYAEGVLSEAENQEITPGEFLDQRLQEAVENYFVSTPQTR